jgi:hypothetical protein
MIMDQDEVYEYHVEMVADCELYKVTIIIYFKIKIFNQFPC